MTLVELLVVLAMLAVLATLALPSYRQSLLKGRRADALLALNAVTQAQERWRAQAPDYASDLVEQLRLPPQSPAGHYRLALADSSATGYAVDARAQGDQADDQRCALMGMRLDNGRLTRVARDHLGRDSSQDCWPH
ncbi:hypothetical protein LZ017_19555 [Pelomonas sp. CA6]|uniref:type IV pilin protein n=1 Tax=Pelomonas sp. CA6 TaxID=2907999 RepID=UPI001F4BDF4E|nr:type IV pilin protein [Pelomonas sp. CA6]MCH7345573.1 hypothetical protein [Pelomonas sp. CA6]